MKSFKNIFSRLIASREITGRVHALSALQRMNDDYLRELGYSPEMVRRGLAGWPWRNESAADKATVAPISSATRVKPSATASQTAASDASADASTELGHAA